MATRNRRTFIHNTSVVALGTLWSTHSKTMALSANEEIRLGFIGCGGCANELMSAFEKIQGVRTVAVCDPDQQALSKARNASQSNYLPRSPQIVGES